MAYIGQSIKNGTFSVLDTSGNTYNSSNVTFNLGTQVGSPAQLLVSKNGVIQKPGTDFTLATGGTQITFTTAPASGDNIFIVEISGAVGGPMNRDINGDELILDVDGDTSITADTDDQIDIKVAGNDRVKLDNTDLTLQTCALRINNSTTGTTSSDGLLLEVSGSEVYFNQKENADIHFRTNNSDRVVISGSGKVGIGETTPEATLHVMNSSAGVGPSANGDNFIIEENDNCGMSILSANNGYGSIMFGDAQDDNIGQIRYDHANDTMSFIASAGSAKLSLDSNSVDTFVNLNVNGTLAKDSGSFRISHPLESKKDTHYLIHYFVESPQANNIYRGKVDLVDGTATVNLDTVSTMTSGTFAALNREIHVYTTNESDWDAVKGSVSGNTLTINCQNASSTATVSWLVIGERQDQHMIDTDWTDSNGKVIVEREKA